jgi:hypothetical protein
MGLSTKQIETFSVNAVRDSLSLTDFLDPFIADNDKEPSWDGHVYIYESKNHKKDNLKGRIPVQVKGKECDDLANDTISFSMSTSDLRNYLYDGGAILFVIYIGKGGLCKKIYYIELPPIRLRLTLASAKEQKTKTITLKEFPVDNNKKSTIFFNCLRNCQMQSSFTDAKLLSFEELEKQGLLEGISVPISGVGIQDDLQRALITNDVYLYAKIKGSSIPQPMEILPQSLMTQEIKDTVIAIGDKVYYSKMLIIKAEGKTTFQIGDSFTISFTEAQKPCSIKYKNSNKARILAKDLDFVLAYIENGYFNINGVKMAFDKKNADLSNFDCAKENAHLSYAKKVVTVLDLLNCNKDIDFSKLSNEDFRNLNRLITAFVDKKPVSNLKAGLPPVIKLSVGELSFALYMKPVPESDTTYEILDFFKMEMSVAYDGKDGEKLPISQYSILHTDDFLTLSNIRFDIFESSFEKCKKHYDTFNRANLFMLDLLCAFDKSEGKRTDILNAAKQFDEWIMTSSEEELPYTVKKLNHIQIVKRERKLMITELAELYGIVESNITSEEALTGAYLLLDQYPAAEMHYLKLTPEQQNNFRSYPIYHFWNNTEEEKDNGQA